MSRHNVVTDNPIRVVRLQHNKTLREFSLECGIHLQAVYLNEAGVYPSILPSILRRLIHHYGLGREECLREYREFVSGKRQFFGTKYKLHSYIPGDSNLFLSPITQLREDIGVTKSMFSKGICCQPSAVSRVEDKKTAVFPNQLEESLEQAGLPVGILRELAERQSEFYYG